MRGRRGARSEFGPAVLAYNLKRAVNMTGAAWMQQALKGGTLLATSPKENAPPLRGVHLGHLKTIYTV